MEFSVYGPDESTIRALKMSRSSACKRVVAALATLALSACGLFSSDDEAEFPRERQSGDTKVEFGGDAPNQNTLNLFRSGGGGGSAAAVAVNTYLWRASLQTIDFMPLASADPFGGVIITDWYQPPESPTERFKITVYILSPELRADGVRAAVFRQRLHPSGIWVDSATADTTATDLENSILNAARELRQNDS